MMLVHAHTKARPVPTSPEKTLNLLQIVPRPCLAGSKGIEIPMRSKPVVQVNNEWIGAARQPM